MSQVWCRSTPDFHTAGKIEAHREKVVVLSVLFALLIIEQLICFFRCCFRSKYHYWWFQRRFCEFIGMASQQPPSFFFVTIGLQKTSKDHLLKCNNNLLESPGAAFPLGVPSHTAKESHAYHPKNGITVWGARWADRVGSGRVERGWEDHAICSLFKQVFLRFSLNCLHWANVFVYFNHIRMGVVMYVQWYGWLSLLKFP